MGFDRKISFHKNYFQEFYIKQTPKVREKIGYVLKLISSVERIPEKFLKHIESSEGLYEIRVQSGNNIFRIFCFFDTKNIVVLFNGFQKKSQKTPKQEIELAMKLKKEYLILKNEKQND
ncbi:MAG TPA: type II toxin-antitoxin system RelE/ParE family toxin [Ignavibacteria bacterium]|nr:type II toxin-antitoxin system RelE/ParE family toxin [Ignavibacteria bacterium]